MQSQVEFNEETNELEATGLQRTDGRKTGLLGDERLNYFGNDDKYDYDQHLKEMGTYTIFLPSLCMVPSTNPALDWGCACFQSRHDCVGCPCYWVSLPHLN